MIPNKMCPRGVATCVVPMCPGILITGAEHRAGARPSPDYTAYAQVQRLRPTSGVSDAPPTALHQMRHEILARRPSTWHIIRIMDDHRGAGGTHRV
ncbi:hypothetical protein GCM10010359_60640 [Streptomyces morookaense]|nr:hypothetical protein GCM10010359_60640 [Streptomyces morookaense]